MSYVLTCSESCKELQNYNDNSFHSVVTDPPYLIELFNQAWDSKDTDLTHVFKECCRVLKPGGYLISFAYPSTYHLIAKMVIVSGFTIVDMLSWQHETGWPKSQDMGRKIEAYKLTGQANMQAIKKAACLQKGVEYIKDVGGHQRRLEGKPKDKFGSLGTATITLDHDNEWSGWYTDIKQTMEPIILAQKPYKGSAWLNCITHGVGALNITAAGVDGKLAGNIFRCAKPSKKERNYGLTEDTDHPSVKPIALMNLLNTLVTPPGGVILDPFCGSGSTGIAAVLQGFNFVGIDKEQKYIDIAKQRIEEYLRHIPI